MDEWKIFSGAFTFVFIAQFGDKAQLATLLLAADQPGARWLVFAGATAALVLVAGIGVIAGAWVSHYAPEKGLKFAAGLGFILMGLWTLRDAMPG